MGTALPWSSTDTIPGTAGAGNMLRAPLGQGLSLLPWHHPSSVAQGQQELTPAPARHCPGIQGAADPQESREAGGACSPGKHKPPTQTGLNSERVLGNSFTKCHWSLEPNLMYRIYYSKQQPCSSCWLLSALPAGGLQYPDSLKQTPSLFRWRKIKT